MSVSSWMSWEGGVDLVGMTAGATQPNIIVHAARMVHTPVGSAPAGMVLIQTDPAGAPLMMGFISTDARVAAYFGPHIFAGTPFENAPVLTAELDITQSGTSCGAVIKVAGHTIETSLTGLGELVSHQRQPSAMPPFAQSVLEATAKAATLKVDGKDIALNLPPVGISGGDPAVWCPAGIYSR